MRVSVCIPTVNRISYLKDALTSLAAQTFSDFEVIIADNSGESGYNEKVRSVVSEFSSISCRVFHHPRTLSMVGNANFLVEHSQADYWIYLPDDDRLRPECLATLVEALDKNPEAGFTFSDHWIIRSDGEVDLAATDANTKRYQRSKLRSGLISHENLFPLALNQTFELQSMLFRSEIIRRLKFNPDSENIPDFDLQLRITQSIPPINAYYCAGRLNEYRIHGGQFTAQDDAKESYRQTLASLEKCSIIPSKFRKQFRHKLAVNHLALALREAAGDNRIEAGYHLRRAFVLDPTYIKVYLYSILFQLPSGMMTRLRSLVRSVKKQAPDRNPSHVGVCGKLERQQKQ